MSIILPGSTRWIVDTPTFMVGPTGSYFRSAFAYPGFFAGDPEDDLLTYEIDWGTVEQVDIATLRSLVEQMLPTFASEGEEVLAYALFEKPETLVLIPEESCIFDFCFTPPFAGTEIPLGYTYRLWVVTRPGVAILAAPSVRALGPAAIIAIGLVFVVAVFTLIGVFQITTGAVKYKDVRAATEAIVKAPGENVATAISGGLTLPLIALGFTLVAAAMFLPAISAKVTGEAPIGPGRVGGELGVAPRPTGVSPRERTAAERAAELRVEEQRLRLEEQRLRLARQAEARAA